MALLQNLTLKKTHHTISRQLGITALLCSTLLLMSHAQAENSNRIVKWKDEKGVTHYGDSIPPQYSNRENSLMNKQGITVQQNKPNAPQDKDAELAKLEQDKKDRALLGTFTNADEIDLTRDRNLEPELLVLKNLQQDRAVAQARVDKSNTEAAPFVKTKKPVPANISNELKANKDALAKIDLRINERQKSIDAIRNRFAEDKKRYLTLRGLSADTPANHPQ